MKLDLSVYLVTDSTAAILKGRDICNVVEEAVKGGEHFEPSVVFFVFSANTIRCDHCPI